MISKIGTIGAEYELGDKCECASSNGVWVVLKGKTVYGFDGNNNFSKDSWLLEAKYESEKKHEQRLKQLRWFCFGCNNIQMP
jgi:hypothetical protein